MGIRSADHSKLPRTKPPRWSSVSTLPRRTPAFIACVSFVPPGTLNPPPAQTPKSHGLPSSGLDCAPAEIALVAARPKINTTPRRRGDTENSNCRMAFKFIDLSLFLPATGTEESIRLRLKQKLFADIHSLLHHKLRRG